MQHWTDECSEQQQQQQYYFIGDEYTKASKFDLYINYRDNNISNNSGPKYENQHKYKREIARQPMRRREKRAKDRGKMETLGVLI